MLHEVSKFRELKSTLYALPQSKANKYEFVPWTAASGSGGIRDTLLHLIKVTWKHGVRSTGDPDLRQRHYKNLVELVDFVLDGRRAYLESIKGTEKYSALLQKYESHRSEMIHDFGLFISVYYSSTRNSFTFSLAVEDSQYELATKLAEKYLDFQTLVLICDQTKNQMRLDEYIERFKDFDFSQFAINWHLQQNKQGALFERFRRNRSDLTRFLSDHPSLAWVQAIFNGNLSKAARVLWSLAQNETDFVARKKTILSLAKLASLAADENFDGQIESINSELLLITYQAQIPTQLLAVFCYDTENPKVLRPEEILNVSCHSIQILFFSNFYFTISIRFTVVHLR